MPDTITLKTGDSETFTVSKEVAMQSETIKNMLEDTGTDTVPLPNVNAPTLSRIIEYCKFHYEKEQEGANTEEMRKWDEEYVNIEQNLLFELILAANYLDIKNLLDLTCGTVADMIKGKTPEQIREVFKIKNDFTPEEEEEVKRENQWAFE